VVPARSDVSRIPVLKISGWCRWCGVSSDRLLLPITDIRHYLHYLPVLHVLGKAVVREDAEGKEETAAGLWTV